MLVQGRIDPAKLLHVAPGLIRMQAPFTLLSVISELKLSRLVARTAGGVDVIVCEGLVLLWAV